MLVNKGSCLILCQISDKSPMSAWYPKNKYNCVYNKIFKFTHSCNFHSARSWEYKNKEVTVVTALEEHMINLKYLFHKKWTDCTGMLPKWYGWFQLIRIKDNTISHIMSITMVEVTSAKRAFLVLIMLHTFQNSEPHQCLKQWFSTGDTFAHTLPRGLLAMSGDIFNCHNCERKCYWHLRSKRQKMLLSML